jgi:hypothetical protein
MKIYERPYVSMVDALRGSKVSVLVVSQDRRNGVFEDWHARFNVSPARAWLPAIRILIRRLHDSSSWRKMPRIKLTTFRMPTAMSSYLGSTWSMVEITDDRPPESGPDRVRLELVEQVLDLC